ncbi:hypothetical protein ALP26_200014 [Pseudomonas savastanoi pv. glycinea]|nr:hypothetical protein ALP26_200014 [Pseudomonas savastanoi pv. glycinea]
MIYDFCVIGGGIVGLATAMQLLKAHPGASLVGSVPAGGEMTR